MTIEIVTANKRDIGGHNAWVCTLEVTRLSQVWELSATAPGILTKAELQAHFEADETRLWVIAERKAELPDVFRLVNRDTLEAFALVIMDELNILRSLHGLPVRTANQIKEAIKNRRKNV